MPKTGYVYIMSNKNRTTLYIGVTNSILRRALEHKTGHGSGFTKQYNLHDLLYYERIEGMGNAIAREKQLKNWHKDWKWNLIKEQNPELKDLAAEWYTEDEVAEYGEMLKRAQTLKRTQTLKQVQGDVSVKGDVSERGDGSVKGDGSVRGGDSENDGAKNGENK